MVKNTLFIILSYLLTYSICSAKITAEVDKTIIATNETIQLTLTITENTSKNPDISVLNENFSILSSGSSSGSSISFSYGSSGNTTYSSYTLSYALMPKRSGTVVIPKIFAGKESTTPISISVRPPKEIANITTADLFIKDSTDVTETYVSSHLQYTIKIYSKNNISPQKIDSIASATIADLQISKLGKIKEYKQRVSGQLYRVSEINLAISPQKAGQFTIPAPIVYAYKPSKYRRSFLQQSETIYAKGREITINVKEKPNSFNNHWWLPAKSLTIQESWAPDQISYKFGEPITRTIIITASGIAAEQLPNITISEPNGVKTYPDKPELDTTATAGEIVATLTQKTLYIPSISGKITLPEISIRWWNTTTDKEQVTTLPAKTISIEQPPIQQHNPPANSLPMAEPKPANTGHIENSSNHETIKNSTIWKWTAILFLALWLITIIMYIVEKKRLRQQSQKGSTSNTNNHANRISCLKKACINNNPTEARIALINWANDLTPFSDHDVVTLDVISNLAADQTLKSQISLLQHTLYHSNNSSWNGQLLWQAVQPIINFDDKKSAPSSPLKTL